MQAYALARPSTRFRLHVVKTKNNKGDFVYAPKADANMEDAAFKVIGKDCTLQCDWTALELGGFIVNALLPKPDTIGSKVANYGAFISIDSRPVSAARGTLRKIAAAIRNRLRKTNSTFSNTKDPFFCLNIICPVDSYDPNIEPAKDDVIFGNESFVFALVDQLLDSYYPKDISSVDSANQRRSNGSEVWQPNQGLDMDGLFPQPQSPVVTSVDQVDVIESHPISTLTSQTQEPRWRSSMYGINEEDLDSVQPSTPFVIDEEEDCHDATISNPWTIARMNAPVRSSKITSNEQLPSPAKSQEDAHILCLTPTPSTIPDRSSSFRPAIPQSTSQANAQHKRLNYELQQSIRRLPQVSSSNATISSHHASGPSAMHTPESTPFDARMATDSDQLALQSSISDGLYSGRTNPRHNKRSRLLVKIKSVTPRAPQDDTWFGQPMRNAPKIARSQKRFRQKVPTFFQNDDTHSSQRSPVLPAAEHPVETRPVSENNSDIRNFFANSRHSLANGISSVRKRNTRLCDTGDQFRAYNEQESQVRDLRRRPQSADSHHRLANAAQEMDKVFQLHQNVSPGHSSGTTCSFKPSIFASPAKSMSSLRRCQTIDSGLPRTRSSTLPLNFTPHNFEIQTLSLTVDTSVSAISHLARRLDMTANSLEWGYDSTDAFDVFGSLTSKRKVMEWVIKIDGLLGSVFERVGDVEVRGALYEGIQRFLDARKEKEEDDECALATEITHVPDSINLHDGSQVSDGGLPRKLHRNSSDGHEQEDDERAHAVADWVAKTTATDAADTSNEYGDGRDFSRAVDVKDEVGQLSPICNLKTEDEFDDDMDDVMLMDF